jgi:hypothetical protein
MVTFACAHAGLQRSSKNVLVRLFRQGDQEIRLWVNAQINDAITGQIQSSNIPELLLAKGQTVVSMDVWGQLLERRPDGTSSVLPQFGAPARRRGTPQPR